jgi:hypothetical protein
MAGHDQTDSELFENIMMGRHMENSVAPTRKEGVGEDHPYFPGEQ